MHPLKLKKKGARPEIIHSSYRSNGWRDKFNNSYESAASQTAANTSHHLLPVAAISASAAPANGLSKSPRINTLNSQSGKSSRPPARTNVRQGSQQSNESHPQTS